MRRKSAGGNSASRAGAARKEPSSTRTPLPATAILVNRVLRYYDRYFKGVGSTVGELAPKVHERFQGFAKAASGDLTLLAERGADPSSLVRILFTDQLFGGGSPWAGKGVREQRLLSSHRYWRRIRNTLKKADNALSEIGSRATVRVAAEFCGSPELYPFVGTCRRTLEAAGKVRDLIASIEGLELHKPGWRIIAPKGSPVIERMEGGGRRKSGRSRKDDWGLCAVILHEYLRRKTGEPHWGAIARLLHFAGYKDFPHLIPLEGEIAKRGSDEIVDRWDYKDKIRWRVRDLWKDSRVVETAERNLLHYGVGSMTTGRYPQDGGGGNNAEEDNIR